MTAVIRHYFLLLALLLVIVPVSRADVFSELDENVDTPRFATLLQEAVRNAATMDDIDRLVQDYLPRLSDEILKAQLLLDAGSRYELAHRFDRAKRMYLQARQALPSSSDIALRLAGVLLEEGSPDEAIILLSNAIHGAESLTQQRRAAFLRSRAYHMNGNTDQAIVHLRSLTAVDRPFDEAHRKTAEIESFALLAELAAGTDRQTLYDTVLSRMEQLFPDAPETLLSGTDTSERITFYPSPSRITGGIGPISEQPVPVETEPVEQIRREEQGGQPEAEQSASESPSREQPVATGIQTGSFRDAENAEYMALDIEDFGFTAEVREVVIDGNTFYRVIVPIPEETEDPQNLVVSLKERGVEGFLVFD
jgi:tetratricopeptide (TPR) repeat protein